MPQVDIIIKTINDSDKGTKKAVGSFTELNSAISLVSKGLEVAKKVYAETIDVTLKYAAEVRDLAIASGTTAEESSRLLQVLDDFQIGAGDVTAAMRAMKEKGLVPTVDTLASLSEQFLAIEDPAKRLQFAQDNLGRSSAKFLNVLSQGPDVIREMNDSIDENLILTDEQIEQTERYRLKIDQIQDTIQGYKIAATLAFFDVQDANELARKTLEAYGQTAAEVTATVKYKADRVQALSDEYDRVNAYSKAWADVLEEEVTPAIEEDVEAVKALSEANANLINDAIDITNSQKDYADSQNDLSKQVDELIAKKKEYYPWEIDKINETQGQIDELTVKYEENKDAFVNAMKEKFAMMAIEKIAMEDGVEGFSQAEYEKAKALLETTDVATAAAFEQSQAQEILTQAVADGTIGVEDFGRILDQVMADGVVSVDEVTAAINGIPTEKTFTLYVNQSGGLNVEGGLGGINQQLNYARGGSFVVPSAYGYEGFNMGGMATASGGETVTVTPKNKGNSGGGIDYNRLARAITQSIMAAGE